jgi:hypothetical protein
MSAQATTPLIVGCMTGAANEVKEHLAKIRRPAKAAQFLDWLERATFGWAGFHAGNGHESSWCFFTLAQVVEATGLNRFDVIHCRAWLVEAHIIWYETSNIPIYPSGKGPDGRIGWNLSFAEWCPPHHGGKRPGGPCKKLPTIADLNVSDGHQEGGGTERGRRSAVAPDAKRGSALATSTISSLQCPQVYNQPSIAGLTQDHAFKPAMLVSLESAAGEAREAPVRKETKERATEEKAKAPPAVSVEPSSRQKGFCWPERARGERDLDFYQRLIQETGENQAVRLLMQLAFEKIGVALSHANYGRMTTLARKHRAAMMVRHILHAAGDHIDKDPMDYLTWLANGKAREEQKYGRAGTQRRETYQPGKERVAAADSPPGSDPSGHAWDGYTHHVVVV